MTQGPTLIYPVHAAEPERRRRTEPQAAAAEEQWDGSNVQYNAWPQEHTRKLLCPICWDVELILASTSFSLPCGIVATGWNTVQSICFSSDAVIASLLCLHDAKVSHPLYLTLTVWMSGNSRRRWWTRYYFFHNIFFWSHGCTHRKAAHFSGAYVCTLHNTISCSPSSTWHQSWLYMLLFSGFVSCPFFYFTEFPGALKLEKS